jgi:hypothetical protein
MPETEFSELKRREKRIVILTVMLFAVGITLTFGSYMNFIVSTTSALDTPVEDAGEYSEVLQSAIFGFQGIMVIGLSLIAAAVILATWWDYVQHRRRQQIYQSWMD